MGIPYVPEKGETFLILKEVVRWQTKEKQQFSLSTKLSKWGRVMHWEKHSLGLQRPLGYEADTPVEAKQVQVEQDRNWKGNCFQVFGGQ